MTKVAATIFVSFVAAAVPFAVEATTYDNVYVFGDSLSDRGNLAETGFLQTLAGQSIANYPNPPSNHDSFTNGPVAVSLLANSYGLAADPSLWVTGFKDVHGLFGGLSYVPGTNYAVAGATSQLQEVGGTGSTPPSGINLPSQIAAYNAATGNLADPNALYTVFIGGNDVRNAALNGNGTTQIPAGVQAEVAAVQTLVTEGARNLLVVNVPNVGIIPEFAQDNPAEAAAATNYSMLYDTDLATSLNSLNNPAGTRVTQFDLYSYNAQIVANAAQLGFTNTTDRCYTATPLFTGTTSQCGPGAVNIDQFFYWDSIHPTGRVQALDALGFEAALAGEANPSPVPEPASLAALLTGVLALGAMVRHRR